MREPEAQGNTDGVRSPATGAYSLLGMYQIARVVAEGMLTWVLEATDPRIGNRRVALKVLRYRVSPQWFLRFAQTNASLCAVDATAGLVPYHQVGVADGRPFIAMTLIDGDDLGNGIADWAARPAEETTAILRRVAATLDYAHGRGIAHGFVHPRHILRGSDGAVWVIDFAEWPPPPDCVLGNPVHHAPEQLATNEVTPRTDVYGLAETAFWMLSGVHPFQHVRGIEMLAAKQAGPRMGLQGRPPLPQAVELVLTKGMAPQPEDRFASAAELVAALVDAYARRTERSRKWWHL